MNVLKNFGTNLILQKKNPTKYKILNNSSEDILNLIKEIDL